MDTKQIEYILKIAEENNITHAAAKLFITQSALNQQLIKLENELGTPLFYRSRTNWRPTEAGNIYIRNAKEILRLKKETYQMIYDLTSGKSGRLSIGFTPGRGINMFTRAYSIFHKQYPNITIDPIETNVHSLQKMISQGDLDICFLTLTEGDKTDDVYEIFSVEELLLVVPSDNPLAKHATHPGKAFATMDVSLLKDEPFVLMNRNSTMRSIVDKIFSEAGFSPQILFETRNNNTIISMIQAGMCCGIIPYYYVSNIPKGVACFSLPQKPTWEFGACYKRGSYLSQAARCFIDEMKKQAEKD